MSIEVLKYQAGDESLAGSKDPKLGIVSWRLKCLAPNRESAINGPLPEDFSPLIEWQPRTFTRRGSGEVAGYDVNVTVEGHPTPDEADGEEFGFDGSLADDAIETNTNYLNILKAFNGKEDKDGRAKFPKTLAVKNALGAATGETVRNRMHGADSFRNPGIIWTHKWVSPSLDSSIVRILGTIDTPRFGPGGALGLSGNRNWLCIRAGGLYRGNIWQLSQSWELSGPYGWVPEVYGRRVL